MRAALADMDEAIVFVIPPPVIQGIGNGGGYPHDRPGPQRQGLPGAGAGRLPADRHGRTRTRGLANVFTLFNTATPRICADIDRAKADMLGVPPERVFEALQVYLGSAYVNDFNLLGRTYRVTAQADAPYPRRPGRHRPAEDPLEQRRDGADRLGRDLPGQDRPVSRDPLQPLPGGRGRRRDRARLSRPASRWARWRSWRRSCRPASRPNGPASPSSRRRPATSPDLIFALAVVFVFLVLAAQYESLTLPLAIILIVPMMPARGDGRREPARAWTTTS